MPRSAANFSEWVINFIFDGWQVTKSQDVRRKLKVQSASHIIGIAKQRGRNTTLGKYATMAPPVLTARLLLTILKALNLV